MGFEIVIQSPFAVAAYPPGATFGPRRLHNYEFVWIMEGDTAYKVGEQAEIAAPQNSIVLCRPETTAAVKPQTDFFRWDAARRTRHAYFHFDLTGDLPSDWPMLSEWPRVQTPQTNSGDLLTILFRQLLAAGGANPLAGAATQTGLLACALLGAFVTGQFAAFEETVGPSGAPLPDLVRETLAFIAARLDENAAHPLALDDLARAACVTPAYLCRVFAQTTGHSPMETVRQARLDKAAVMLARTNFSVGEIADLCGFASAFHFSRRFRDTFGASPRQMRDKIARGDYIPASRLDRRIAGTWAEE